MPLHPHAKRFLEMAAAAGTPQMSHVTPSEMRRTFETLVQTIDREAVAIGEVVNSTLPGPGGPLAIRIYSPIAGHSGSLPALIYFHGGGCVFGSLDTHDNICRRLSN